MKIIEDLYYGNIDPHTRHAQSDTTLSKMRLLLIQNENVNRRRAQQSGSAAEAKKKLVCRCGLASRGHMTSRAFF